MGSKNSIIENMAKRAVIASAARQSSGLFSKIKSLDCHAALAMTKREATK